MKWMYLFLFIPLLLQASDEHVTWSQPLNGLRARLFISPSRDPDFDYAFQVYLQFENVGVVGSLGTIREDKRFQYSELGLALDVNDSIGRKVPLKIIGIFDGMVPSWNLCLPWGGNMAFPIGHISGSGTPHLEITPLLAWDLPVTDKGPYYLSGAFSTKFPRPNPPRDLNVRLNWEGTLVLPPVEIPQKVRN